MDPFKTITIFIFVSVLAEAIDINFNLDNTPRYLSRRREQFRVLYEWKTLNFTWPSDEAYQKAIKNNDYIPNNVLLSGIKIFNDYIYVTLPRLKVGVPATIARIPANPVNLDTSPRLEPFPSWELNVIGDCRGFQSVQSLEIDLTGHMWVIDNGRIFPLRENGSVPSCSPSLTIIDLNEGRNTMVRYHFPEHVADLSSYLNDIVIDDSEGGYAYISDNSHTNPGIIVFSKRENKSWKFKGSRKLYGDSDAAHFNLNGFERTIMINVDGIALSPRFVNKKKYIERWVYFCPLSSHKLYGINTVTLKNETLLDQAYTKGTNYVRFIGRKSSQTDGMIMDEEGFLYFGLIGEYAIAQWNSFTNFTTDQEIIAKDKNMIQWPDRFAFDTFNNLHVVTNRMLIFIHDRFNMTEVNYRILKANVGVKSYLYGPMFIPTS